MIEAILDRSPDRAQVRGQFEISRAEIENAAPLESAAFPDQSRFE